MTPAPSGPGLGGGKPRGPAGILGARGTLVQGVFRAGTGGRLVRSGAGQPDR